MLTEASMHLLSWIPKTREAAMRKGELLPQFPRNTIREEFESVVTNHEWPTKNEQQEMCWFTQRHLGRHLYAAVGTGPVRLFDAAQAAWFLHIIDPLYAPININ